MRIRPLALIALLALPSISMGQVRPRPRIPRGPAREPAAPLPPEAGPVARALAYRRSRWSAEAYSVINAMQVPAATGGVSRYTTFGAGTRGDYRFSDRFSATVDLTASPLGGSAITETAEVGSRFRPMPWDEELRPFFDLRAGYMHMYDQFAVPMGTGGAGIPNQQFASESRYGRGFGGIVGAGLEFSLTRTWALTTEAMAMRNRLTTYRLTGPASIPNDGRTYWMTSLRYAIGFKFNPVSALHMAQKPSM